MDPRIPPELEPVLGQYLKLLQRWNRIHALTSLPPEAMREELLLDSCALLPHLTGLGSGAKVLDLGTGMGIPAVVLALARPDLEIIAIDSSRKKISFLRQACLEIGLGNLSPVCARFDDLDSLDGDLGVAKALAPMGQLLAWWRELGRPQAPFLALKGPEWETEPTPPGWSLQGHAYALPRRGNRWVVEARPDPA